jgi:hypothetical protein
MDDKGEVLFYMDLVITTPHEILTTTKLQRIPYKCINVPQLIRGTFSLDWMYITDWRLDAIIKLHKLSGELEEVLVRESQTNRLYGVKVYSGTVQSIEHNQPCSVNNGGCEKLCFAIPRNNTPVLQVSYYFN